MMSLTAVLGQHLQKVAENGAIDWGSLTHCAGPGQTSQGRFLVRPFHDPEGRGVLLINLETDERTELRHSVYIERFETYSVDFGNAVIDPSGHWLFVLGAGLEPDTFQRVVKGKWSFPGSQLLMFDLTKLTWTSRPGVEQRVDVSSRR